jgi:uncharacterized protein
MKKLIFVFVIAIGTGTFGIYGQTKDDDIIRLLRISGTEKLTDQMLDVLIPQFKQLVPGIPDAFWAKFREKMNINEFILASVPVYSKYYTHDEIKQLIIFYESPLGKRMIEVTPLLTQETMSIGQKWGEKLGQEIFNELIKDGYIDL